MRTPTDRERLLLGALAVLVAVVWVYQPTLNYEFVYDDIAVAGGNPAIAGASNLRLLFDGAYFRTFEENTYRPVTTLTYFADRAIWGAEPFGFNFTGMLIHFLNGALVLLFVRRFTRSPVVAGWAAVMFVLHPVCTEAVISEGNREEALGLSFLLAAFLLYGEPRTRRTASACVFAAGLFAMEMIVTLPALLVVYEWWRAGDEFDRREAARRVAPFLAIAAVYLLLRFTVFVGTGAIAAFPGGRLAAIATAPSVLIEYARLLLFPVGLRAIYDFPVNESLLSARALFSWAAILAMVAACWFLLKTRRVAGFSLAWFLIVLLPVSHLVIPFWIVIAERYLYLVLPGFVLLLALGADGRFAFSSEVWRRRYLVLLAAIPVLYAYGAVDRTKVWSDNETLWEDTVEKAPGSLDAQHNMGVTLVKKREPDRALYHFAVAGNRHPGAAGPWVQIASLHRQAGRFEEAERALARAFEIDPDNSDALLEKGYLDVDRGDVAAARGSFEKAVAASPDSADAWAALAGCALSMNDSKAAVKAAGRALAIDETNAPAIQVLAHVAASAGKTDMAVKLYADVYRHARNAQLADTALANIRRLARRSDG